MNIIDITKVTLINPTYNDTDWSEIGRQLAYQNFTRNMSIHTLDYIASRRGNIVIFDNLSTDLHIIASIADKI